MYENTAEKSFDHGFFFIGDTFYNDTRQPTIDYSEVIRNWAKTHDNIAELKTDSMEDIKFQDLTVRLGYPYLYQHYGNCEHLFTISDIRLISGTDSLIRAHYPLLKIVSSSKSVFCMICGVNEANMVVKDSSAHINDPSILRFVLQLLQIVPLCRWEENWQLQSLPILWQFYV